MWYDARGVQFLVGLNLFKTCLSLLFFDGPSLPFFSDMILSRVSCVFALLWLSSTLSGVFAQNANTSSTTSNHTTVLILGGGMTGIIAARTLHEQGIDDFIILDGKTELGGRMIPKAFGVTGRQVVVELGPNWVQGTQQGNGTANPIWELAIKHNLTTVYNDMYGSVSMCIIYLVSYMPGAHGSQLLMMTVVIIIIPTCSTMRWISLLRPPSSQVY